MEALNGLARAILLSALSAAPVQAGEIEMTGIPLPAAPDWMSQLEIRRPDGGRILARAAEGIPAGELRKILQDGFSASCEGRARTRRVTFHDIVLEADPDFLAAGQVPETSYARRMDVEIASAGTCHAIAALSAESFQAGDRLGTSLVAGRIDLRGDPASGVALSISDLDVQVAGSLPLLAAGSLDLTWQDAGEGAFTLGARWSDASLEPRFLLGLEGAGGAPVSGDGEIAMGCAADGFTLLLDVDMDNLTDTVADLGLVAPHCRPGKDSLLVHAAFATRDRGLLDLLKDAGGWTPTALGEGLAERVPALLAGVVKAQVAPVSGFIEASRAADMAVEMTPAEPVGVSALAPLAILGPGAVARKLGIDRNNE